MANSTSVSNWLGSPTSFSEADRKGITMLTKKYPYFVPVRYLEAAEKHKNAPFAPAMLTRMQLFNGNWLLFNEFLQSVFAEYSPHKNIHRETLATTKEEDVHFAIDDAHAKEISDEPVFDDIANFTDTKPKAEKTTKEAEPDEEKMPSFEEMKAEVEGLPENDEEAAKLEDSTVTIKYVNADRTQSIWEEDNEIEAETKPEVIVDAPEPIPEAINEEPETIKVENTTHESISWEEDLLVTEELSKEEVTHHETDEIAAHQKNDLIQPYYTEDYFMHQGIPVSNDLPQEEHVPTPKKSDDPKSLMVVMSFADWLNHFKTKGVKDKEEKEDQKALKTMWQKEKLAAAMEEENEEIPENVFEMAVNSITKEEDLASESLAEILIMQKKYDKAIDMYRKLSLRNPQKSAYFARKIEGLIKEKES